MMFIKPAQQYFKQTNTTGRDTFIHQYNLTFPKRLSKTISIHLQDLLVSLGWVRTIMTLVNFLMLFRNFGQEN